MRICRLCLATCLLMVATVSIAVAEKIDYGDFIGADVEFSGVTEDSLTDGLPLFDEPMLAGASLVFNPSSFGAFSEGGGIDLTDSSLTMTIRAINELGMRAIKIVEAGDYTLAGMGTSRTHIEIAAPVLVTIIEVDGISIDPILLTERLEITTSNAGIDGNFNLVDDEKGAGISWRGDLTIDLDAALAENNISGSVTKVFLNMDNSLLAESEPDSLAFVKKKAASVGITPIIPEPSTFLLSVLGVMGLVGSLRRRRNRRVG